MATRFPIGEGPAQIRLVMQETQRDSHVHYTLWIAREPDRFTEDDTGCPVIDKSEKLASFTVREAEDKLFRYVVENGGVRFIRVGQDYRTAAARDAARSADHGEPR